ncbi:MAG: aspartyl protease family protein [Cytophagales bacterium]
MMGLIHAEIELINGIELGMVSKHLIDKEDVKRIWVNALVDTGSYMLAINENIQEILGLAVVEKRNAELANGQIISCDVVAPVELRFKNRATTCRAIVLPGDSEVLLGAIPLEDMDVIIHPLRQELMVNPDHPTMAQMKLK